MGKLTVGHRVRRSVAAVTALGLLALAACDAPPPTGPAIEPGDPGAADVRLDVDAYLDTRYISRAIYGSNVARDMSSNKLTMLRLGGNRWTGYNWETNASNAGSDWCYQNDAYLSGSATPGEAVRPTVQTAKDNGASIIVTVPIVDYVAADKNGGSGPPECSGDIRKSANYQTTRLKANVADKPGALSLVPSTSDGSVYQEEYVNWLRQAVPGTDVWFSLDNEPDLWADTHPQLHTGKVGYAELVERSIRYSRAIKGVWPEAKVTGPASYGFYGFERLQDAPDAAGRNFLDFYLQQMAAAQTTYGTRLLDHLDLHWYPEARGGGVRISGGDNSAAVAAARVQAPRSLWDPTYVEDSWITNDYGYGPIRLIPRTRDRIAANYPGTGLTFSEWNYGGGNHISGAIAVADVLGIMGRERVDAATYWELLGDESYAYAAFRAFRNYDGAGSAFLPVSVRATTSDVGTATVYASTSNEKTVIIAINKSTTPKTAGITVRSPNRYTKADVWTLTSAGPSLQPGPQLTETATNAFRTTLPAMSVSVIVPKP